MDASFSIPVTLWNVSKPVFRISTICISPNLEKLVTGSYNGQLCLWNIDLQKEKITPRNILIGHKDSVTCASSTNEYVISCCEGKMICRWNLEDGYCIKMNTSVFIHRKMQLFLRSDSNEEFLFTCGDYPEIMVIHPFTLQVMLIFYSKSNLTWISQFQIISSEENKMVSGITVNGCVKLWLLNDLESDVHYETHSYVLPTTEVVDFKYNFNSTQVLIVTVNSWMLYDSNFSNCMCKAEADKNDKLVGGSFCDSNVVIWAKSGMSYLYNVINGAHMLISVFLDSCNKVSLFEPALTLLESEIGKYLVRGNTDGRISIWKIDSPQKELLPLFSATLYDNWVTNGFLNNFVQYSSVTCCIYILEIDRFFVGCLNGTIVSIPATDSIKSFYFGSTKPLPDVLVGHKGRITCLLYPHEKHSYFSKSHLVSGGSDFCVCLWDVFKSELISKFCVQSGEILKLIVPSEHCNLPVRMSVCSISADHSAAVLSLKDKRCLLLTSRHEYPIVSVHWKPLDDFMIVECFDGTIYVWQMETRHLDRVLNGVTAQEVIYACNELDSDIPAWNFYIDEHYTKDNSMKKNIFRINESIKPSPFMLNDFLTNEISESHIFVCNLESTIAQFNCSYESEAFDCAINPAAYLLTKANDLNKKTSVIFDKLKQEIDYLQTKSYYPKNNNFVEVETKAVDNPSLKLIEFFLSSLHFWGVNPNLDEFMSSKLGLLKPERSLCFGIPSYPGIYSLFLPTVQNDWQKNSSLFSSICVAVITLSKILLSQLILDQDDNHGKKIWLEELLSFYELNLAPKPKIEILAKKWNSKCLFIQKIVRKLLCNYIQGLDENENVNLLKFWYNYLPHFKTLDKTLSEKTDFENVELKTVALVIFGIVGSDLKFKSSDSSCQENYIYQTCAAFVYLMLLPNDVKLRFSTLQTIAVDFIGRGYIVWEQFLKMEKVVPALFKICTKGLDCVLSTERSLAAYNALKSIAIVRTAAFINCLKSEIAGVNTQTQNSKAEILSILTFLLEKSPYIMIIYLNDVISLLVYCIDFSHLRHENLSNLIPVMRKFRQVHHSVTSQRIAVGLATGSLVLHDLRTGKIHEISAHNDSVSALKFSEDGKSLASYSCYENRLSFWQVLTGMFGLGHVNVKCTKSCKTYQIHDEEIKNHLEIASLTWTDKKSVMLSLCDGTEDVFHS